MTATALQRPRRRAAVLGSTIGNKLVVAATGLGWVGFVFAHMIGNLKIFLGPVHFNEYGEFLRDMGEPVFPRSMLLWILRLGLIAAFVGHVVLTFKLALRSRASRKSRYAKTATVTANRASLTMRWGGIALFLFIFVHLAHLTWGIIPLGNGQDYRRGDVYGNVTNAFYHQPWWTILYIIPMLALALHLYHGVWSTMQTLGVNRKRFDKGIKALAVGVAVVCAGGNIAIVLGATFIRQLGT